jgi:asparagine synthase (glutamine-hydrolysing)
MCGIAGIVNRRVPVELSTLRLMTDSIAHRGPDGEGHWMNLEARVGLGHRRLSIIDLSEGASQPMHDPTGRYTIVFNGEIYNYIELREQLIKSGSRFRTQSDTEVLLTLYATKKERCLKDLDGMFAFSIWDEQEQTLFCARDRFGEKPFYYHWEQGICFAFGSEMKSLWASGVPKSRNERMLFNFMLNRFCLDNIDNPSETFFRGIQKLEPAHYLIVDRELNLIQKPYWDIDLSLTNESISFENACETFRELMHHSITCRLRSDVPIGSSLSGGLDSSTIVCLIDQLNRNKELTQKTFSARFRNFERDEGAFIQRVIDVTSVEPHFTWPDETSFADDFARLCHHQEEPFPSASIFAQWKVMQLAKENKVVVLIDGQGADETLAGYQYYFPTYLHSLHKKGDFRYTVELEAYRRMHNPEFAGYGEISKNHSPRKVHPALEVLKGILRPLYRSLIPNRPLIPRQLSVPVQAERWEFLTPEFASAFGQKDIITTYKEQNLINRLYFNTRVYGLQDLLRFADRSSMGHSREVRLPFLSHQLVEFIFSLPDHYKIHEGWTKYVLRKSFESILPKEIAWRVDKVGYEPPQKKWMENPLIKEMIRDAFGKLEKEKIVNPGYKKDSTDLDWCALTVANTLF